jgi:outer membrane protein
MQHLSQEHYMPTAAIILLFYWIVLLTPQFARAQREVGQSRLALTQCIDIALAQNQWRPLSQLEVEIAQAQHQQALSAYWPQAGLTAALVRRDEALINIFPQETSVYSINLLGQPLDTEVTIAEKNIRLMDPLHFQSAVDIRYPLYAGGLRRSYVRQAKAGIEAARQQVRRSELQIIHDVRRYYWSAVLAQGLFEVGDEARARLEVTLELTENLYLHGSGSVKKTDFLQSKVMVESVRALVAELEGNTRLARAALANSMGLRWDAEIEPVDRQIPYDPLGEELQTLVAEAYRFNPDWGRMEAGLLAAEAQLDEAKSGHKPKIALLGQLLLQANPYDKGIVGPQEDRSWMVGIGLELPLFNGFRTTQEIRAARAHIERRLTQQNLLRDGLALQVKAAFIDIERAQAVQKATAAAAQAAAQNRDLNERAYRLELVEVQDMIQAQIVESFTRARQLKAHYDHAMARAQLEFIIGRELERLAEADG